jgi:uncharacterized SAM-binding protein YcdF (DUF218 family)
MLDVLKPFINLSNFFLAWTIFIVLSYVLKKQRVFKVSLFLGVSFFLLCSTNYIPKKLIRTIEEKYAVLNIQNLDTTKHYYIHVLGAGYSLDANLPAVSQLDTKTLARLTEGIRVFRQVPYATLITSGYSSLGLQSQASVAKQAAIELGVPEAQIQMLETPSTTLEEVQAFKDKFGLSVTVIIATDATHMPRAMKIYRAAGYEPIAAPTNFRVKFGPNSYHGVTLPSIRSMQIMENWIIEILAGWKLHLES